ncbi:MAG TPA: DUF2628 domain-containing protein [Alphaproteobacteria bacterium]|nr:DUF2628 domain-containing protein [Alphaproteobacteria bacterium]
MRIYTVHSRPVPRGADPDFVLVKEGFNWPALFVPLLWGLVRGQWLGLIAYLALAALLGVVARLMGLGELGDTALGLLFALFVAAEANDWRRWRLAAAGYRLVDLAQGRNLEEAEAAWLQRQAAAEPAEPAPRETPPAPRPSRLAPFASPFDPAGN